MFDERRRQKREPINRWAKIALDGGAFTHDCLVVNLSISGARLICEMDEIPQSFAIQVSGNPPIRQECHVVWRIGTEVGVEFVTEQERLQKTTQIVQAEARAVFNNSPPENINKNWRKSISAHIDLLNKSAGSILRSPIRSKARTRPPS
jgi:hypothetical protein